MQKPVPVLCMRAVTMQCWVAIFLFLLSLVAFEACSLETEVGTKTGTRAEQAPKTVETASGQTTAESLAAEVLEEAIAFHQAARAMEKDAQSAFVAGSWNKAARRLIEILRGRLQALAERGAEPMPMPDLDAFERARNVRLSTAFPPDEHDAKIRPARWKIPARSSCMEARLARAEQRFAQGREPGYRSAMHAVVSLLYALAGCRGTISLGGKIYKAQQRGEPISLRESNYGGKIHFAAALSPFQFLVPVFASDTSAHGDNVASHPKDLASPPQQRWDQALDSAFFNRVRALPAYPVEIRTHISRVEHRFTSPLDFFMHDVDHAIEQAFYDRWWMAQHKELGGIFATKSAHPRAPSSALSYTNKGRFHRGSDHAIMTKWWRPWHDLSVHTPPAAVGAQDYIKLLRFRFEAWQVFLNRIPQSKLRSAKEGSLFEHLHEQAASLWIEERMQCAYEAKHRIPYRKLVGTQQDVNGPKRPFMVLPISRRHLRWPGSLLPIRLAN